MASPMRKKRAWSTPEEDARVKESAAFEASVAAAKDTAARSGAFLSSAKEDLTDHQRWLRAQSAAVERDRQRHEKWLQRQRDQEHAAMRKERIRRRRSLMRQRALQAVQQAFLDVIHFVRSWIVFFFGRVAGGIKSAGLTVGQGLARAGQTIGLGVSWAGAKSSAAFSAIGQGLSAGAAWGGAKARAGSAALSAGSSAVVGEAGKLKGVAGSSLGEGLASARAKGSQVAAATGQAAGRGGAAFAAKASVLGASLGRGLSGGYAWTKSRLEAIPPALYVQLAKVSHNVQRFTQARVPGGAAELQAQTQAEGPLPPAASVHVLEVYGPHEDDVALFGRSANEPWTPGDEAGLSATDSSATDSFAADLPRANLPAADLRSDGEAHEPVGSQSAGGEQPAVSQARDALAAWVQGSAERAKSFSLGLIATIAAAAAWLGAKAAQAGRWAKSGSWANREALAGTKERAEAWARTKGFELSQMMVIAGAVLLVCGGLLVGGGLLMRAGAKAPAIAEAPGETFSGITWTFNETDLPLPARAVFTLSGTPQAFLVNGLSISGINNTDGSLTAVEASLKPDVQRPDLKLSLVVDQPKAPAGGESVTMTALPPGTVPAQTPFRLVFPFPPEAMDGAEGLTVDEFFESYGGLFLTLRYVADGVEKSVFQYLAPDMLKAQLEEVSTYAGDS